MAVKNKEMLNDDGTKSTLVITSNDDKSLIMTDTYVLANHKKRKESPLVKKFKGSVLGADIGFKSSGFTNVAILAVVLALSALVAMYFMWRI